MQITSWPRWLKIVSTRTAVLPVERSPMISSRWPRPIGIIESIALRPVWSGSFTGWRSTTPGALNSSGRVSSRGIGSPPSSGLPSGSTIRPISASPTGTLATRPERLTGSPSLTSSQSPNSAAPTLSSSRLNARPVTPCSSSSISSATAFSSPWMRAMPSPTWRTFPTSARSVSTSNFSIRSFRIEVISSGRSFTERSFVSSVPGAAGRGGRGCWRRGAASRSGGRARRRGSGRRRARRAPCGRTPVPPARRGRRTPAGRARPPWSARRRGSPAPGRRAPRTRARSRGARPRGPSRPPAGRSCGRARRRRRGPGPATPPSPASRARGSRARPGAPRPGRPSRRSPPAAPGPARAAPPPGRPRRARARTSGARPPLVLAPLQHGEVELLDRLVDQAAVIVLVEHLARDARGRDDRQLRHFLAQLLERAARLGLDLLARVLDPALALGLELLAQAIALGVADTASLAQDLLGLAARLVHERAVLLEQPARLVAGAVCLPERFADPLPALVDDLLDRAERELLQDKEGDPEADEGPDHQTHGDVDEGIRCERHGDQTRTKASRPPIRP